jgi:hypothetical protein
LVKQHAIVIDEAVEATLWRDRQAVDQSLNAVLRRRLGLAPLDQRLEARPVVLVERTGVRFVAGFEIFRLYKGREYRAQAVDGGWLLVQTGEVFASLNKLSRGIGTGIENAWNYWRYIDASGVPQLLATLRPKF